MGLVQDLYTQFGSYMRITSYVTARVGSQINEGEPFAMYVEMTNTAPETARGGTLERYLHDRMYEGARVVFVNLSISIEETEYADLISPVGSFGWTRFRGITNMRLPDQQLLPGETFPLRLQFVARRSFDDWFHDAFNTEQVAKVAVTWDVDWAELMRHTTRATIQTEIDHS